MTPVTFSPMLAKHEWAWIKNRAHIIGCEDSQGIVAYRGERIVAACVADSFTVNACNVHMAIDDPFVIRSGFLSEIARHLFINCDRRRIFGLVPSNNEKALKLDKHIGFTEIAVIPDALADGVDYVVLRMDKEDCPWLEEKRWAA